MMNLRDNKDGSCNCRPLGNGCFFTDGFDGPCRCKCHDVRSEEWERSFRKMILELDDFHTTFTPDNPIKGDIYFDGIETEQFIRNLLISDREKVIKEVEGMKKDITKYIQGATPKHQEEIAHGISCYNDAISDVLLVLKDKK